MLRTSRLQLAPLSPNDLLALIDGEEHFAKSFGMPGADGLRMFVVSDGVSPEWLAALRARPDADPWTHGFAVVYTEQGLVIGTVGFKGQPDETGAAEISYGIVPAFEGHGYTTEATAAATRWAFDSGKVQSVLAHTLPAPSASTRVLEKCGFRFVGDVVDPDDGPVWRWQRDTTPTSG